MKVLLFLLALSVFVTFENGPSLDSSAQDTLPANTSSGAVEPHLVSFPGPENMTLHGFLYMPTGQGPFPAMLWNHGSEAMPGWQPDLAEFYTSRGYVFFIPHRHGQGRSKDAGRYHMDLQHECKSQACVIELHEKYNRDVVAAVDWLRQQPFVDKHRIVMSGVSFGGIQTLLSAERGLDIAAFVPFAPAAMSWKSFPDLRARLLRAEEKSKSPIFLIQAEGDYDTGPYAVLGSYLTKKGGLNRSKLYPKFGTSNREAHAVFATRAAGINVWREDVLEFLGQSMK